MQTQAEITYHHMEPAPHVEARVNDRIARLERHFGHLVSCRVVIDAPHLRHGKGNHYTVRLDAHMPTATFAVDREPGDVNAHADVVVAIRDAFDALERQIRRWKETHSGRPPSHAQPLQGRITELRIDRDFGWVALTDGRLVYFHRNSVVDGDFEALAAGDTVALTLDEGGSEAGPHARSVRPISPQRFIDRPD